jgi:hypothetical protein
VDAKGKETYCGFEDYFSTMYSQQLKQALSITKWRVKGLEQGEKLKLEKVWGKFSIR